MASKDDKLLRKGQNGCLLKYTHDVFIIYIIYYISINQQSTIYQQCILWKGFEISPHKLLIHLSSVVKHVHVILCHWFIWLILYSSNTSSTSLAYYWFSHYTFYDTIVLNTKPFWKIQLKQCLQEKPYKGFTSLKCSSTDLFTFFYDGTTDVGCLVMLAMCL